MGGKELAVVKSSRALNLREVAARTTLREIRLQRHVYIELRQVRKRTIFFCTLCQCFNDSVLNDHLKGNLHSRRYAGAKVTLFGTDPWPFSGGVLFFNTKCEVDVNGDEMMPNFKSTNLAVSNSSNGGNVANGCKKSSTCIKGHGKVSKHNGKANCLVIPRVLLMEEVINMRCTFIGNGHIGARVHETDVGRQNIVEFGVLG